ncbi:MAG: chemotaxis protein CheD [Burkholderiaceae bacterium]|nr:chemotaxis protein CheD [Burkholderiaceae bacterium]
MDADPLVQFRSAADIGVDATCRAATDAGRGRERPGLLVSNGLLDCGTGGEPQVFLRPGDWLFGGGEGSVRTLLGSCVSLVLWSRRHGAGGLCHSLLPQRRQRGVDELPDGRYLDEAIDWLEAEAHRRGIPWADLRASVFGGAGRRTGGIGASNLAWICAWLERQRIPVDQMDVGGHVMRRLSMDLRTGVVSVAHGGAWNLMEQRQ